ncbi:hypothetical protein [Mucilaginibacter sp. CSA2-8R]|uniref:DUF4377 domain-containing protein n=1 Tax=Mucilaginibacter sp. CSA2-8R TaxID=3141542 RepID=UPI00315CA702
MKKLIAGVLLICLVACKKENVYGPLQLRNGQVVELQVDHRYAADQDKLLKLPENVDAGSSLVGFINREPGYTYRIKARFTHTDNPPADGASSAYEFINIISSEKYQGNEPFTVPLIVSYIPGGPSIRLSKAGNNYYIETDKLQLTYNDPAIGAKLEDIWQQALYIRTNWQTAGRPKWTAIKATVTHDPQKFSKAYLVQQLEFTP